MTAPVLIAARPLTYRGERLARGDRLDPPPAPDLARKLVDQRKAYQVDGDAASAVAATPTPPVGPSKPPGSAAPARSRRRTSGARGGTDGT